MSETRLKIAVFIDFDNIEIGVKTTLGGHFDVGAVLEAIKERGEVVTKIAYGDWTRAGDYSRSLTQHAIHMVQRNLTPGGDKNGADINLALDALEMAFTHSHINAFVIVGGDSDFMALVEKLKQYDRKVFVVGGRAFTSVILQKNCTEFIAYENLVGATPRSKTGGRAGGRPGETPAVQAVPLIRRALKVLTDREVSPQLGVLKSTLLQLDSTFSEREYGASTFRDFVQRLARAGYLTLKGTERNIYVELREGADGAGAAGPGSAAGAGGASAATGGPGGSASGGGSAYGAGTGAGGSGAGAESGGGSTAAQGAGRDAEGFSNEPAGDLPQIIDGEIVGAGTGAGAGAGVDELSSAAAADAAIGGTGSDALGSDVDAGVPGSEREMADVHADTEAVGAGAASGSYGYSSRRGGAGGRGAEARGGDSGDTRRGDGNRSETRGGDAGDARRGDAHRGEPRGGDAGRAAAHRDTGRGHEGERAAEAGRGGQGATGSARRDSGVSAQGSTETSPPAGSPPAALRFITDVFQRPGIVSRWPLYLRQVKQILRSVDETFDERRYGFNGIVEALRYCQREGLFRLDRDRQGVLRVYPGPVLQRAATTAARTADLEGAMTPAPFDAAGEDARDDRRRAAADSDSADSGDRFNRRPERGRSDADASPSDTLELFPFSEGRGDGESAEQASSSASGASSEAHAEGRTSQSRRAPADDESRARADRRDVKAETSTTVDESEVAASLASSASGVDAPTDAGSAAARPARSKTARSSRRRKPAAKSAPSASAPASAPPSAPAAKNAAKKTAAAAKPRAAKSTRGRKNVKSNAS